MTGMDTLNLPSTFTLHGFFFQLHAHFIKWAREIEIKCTCKTEKNPCAFNQWVCELEIAHEFKKQKNVHVIFRAPDSRFLNLSVCLGLHAVQGPFEIQGLIIINNIYLCIYSC